MLTEKLYPKLLGEGSTKEQRLELNAYLLGAKTEYWRAHRNYAGILHFVYLTCSYPGVFTADHFEDVRALTLNPWFEDYMGEAMKPLGVYLNFFQPTLAAGKARRFQVMMVNDEIGKKTRLGYRVVLSDFDWAIPDGKAVKVVGTPLYRSPEHYRNQTPTYQSDIFTLGIMIHEFLTGRNPFDHNDEVVDEELIKDRVLKLKLFKQPKELQNKMSERVNNILNRCFGPDPAGRPRDGRRGR